ncbi:MAG: flagellar export protein FliJ [Gemmatimonadota bacterium]
MFRFPLQRLLELKAMREREMAREFADARRKAEADRLQQDSLSAIHEDANRQLAGTIAGAPTAGEVLSLSYSVLQLRERLDQAAEVTKAAERVALEAQDRLTGAMQERQVLARLRERRHEEHRTAENAREQGVMDEIAISRFNAPRKGTENTEEGK